MRVKTDKILFSAILLLLALGLVFAYSALMADGMDKSGTESMKKQLVATGIGLVGMMALKWRHHFYFRNWMWAAVPLAVMTVLAAVAYFVDAKHRWLPTGFLRLQPSEIAKPCLILCVAYVLYEFRGRVNEKQVFWPLCLAIALVVGVVGMGDFGTAMVLGLTSGVMLLISGISWKNMLQGGALLGVLCAVLVLSEPFRVLRLVAVFDPDHKLIAMIDRDGSIEARLAKSKAPKDMRYQAEQSKIAIGSRGWRGLGLMQGRHKIAYLPESHNDFIFAVIAEETGFGGCLAVLGVYLVIFWRGLQVFLRSSETFGRYVALGVVSCVMLQALINMSVALDMGPTKGLPLPLVSYGGSAMIGTLLAFGLLLSVSDHAVMNEQEA